MGEVIRNIDEIQIGGTKFNPKQGLIPRSSAAQQAYTEQCEVGLLIPRSLLRGRSL